MTDISTTSPGFYEYSYDQNDGGKIPASSSNSKITPPENRTNVIPTTNLSTVPSENTFNDSAKFFVKMAREFGNKINLDTNRSRHFETMASMPEGFLSKKVGQITAQYQEQFSKSDSGVLPKKYKHPGGVEKLRLGNADFYFANTSAPNGPIVFFAHGLLESSKNYAPSEYQSDGTRFCRPNSRADEALHKRYNVAAISFKGDTEDSPLIPSNKDLENSVVNAVKSYKLHIEERGEEFNPENIVLMGKSRGAKAALAAISTLRQDGINIGRIVLEAPIMNSAALILNRTAESFKGKPAYEGVKEVVDGLKIKFIQSYMFKDRDYDLETSLNNLKNQLNEDGGKVIIKVLKGENDSTAGNGIVNSRIMELFYDKGNVVAYGSSDEQGNDIVWNKAKDNSCFLMDGSQKPIDPNNGLFVEYHHIPNSSLHGQNSIQLPLTDGPPEGGFDQLKAVFSGL